MEADDLLREAEDAVLAASWEAVRDALTAYRATMELVHVVVRNERPGSLVWHDAWQRWRPAHEDLNTCWLLRYGRRLEERRRPPDEGA